MIAKSYSVFTKESNAAFMARLQVAHPVTTVAKALADRIKLDDWLSHTLQPRQAQQQWRNMLKAYVSDASAHRNTQPVPSSVTLQLVGDAVHEVFECDICGQQFATAAARKRHQFLAHMTEPEQVERKEKVRESSHTAPMEHAEEGMPWCRHCLKKFNNWPNFYYHVNSRSCDGLRDFYQGQNPGLALAAMNQALIERSDVLEFAQGCTWLELAGHPAVRELIQHCPVFPLGSDTAVHEASYESQTPRAQSND